MRGHPEARVLRAGRAGRPRGAGGVVRHGAGGPAPTAQRRSRHSPGAGDVQADHLEQAQVDGAAGRLPAALRRARLAAVAVVRRRRVLHRDRDRDRDGDRQPLRGRRPGRARQRRAPGQRKEEAPELWRMVENLAITAGLPMPRIYIVNDDAPERVRRRAQPEAGDRLRHDRAARSASTRRSSRACSRTR